MSQVREAQRLAEGSPREYQTGAALGKHLWTSEIARLRRWYRGLRSRKAGPFGLLRTGYELVGHPGCRKQSAILRWGTIIT